ncbi:polysaccharide deacetylase family protein [Peribacillus frigoritolerans]|nr:polysaccharide deacetylase family protein [Peribacillus frigoritolerans]
MKRFIRGIQRKKVVYLTFDNGYENGYTAQILDVLKKHGAPGAFFCHGSLLKNGT